MMSMVAIAAGIIKSINDLIAALAKPTMSSSHRGINLSRTKSDVSSASAPNVLKILPALVLKIHEQRLVSHVGAMPVMKPM